MSEKHVITLPTRKGIVEIVEHPDRIVLKIRFDKYGDFGDIAEIQSWLHPILRRFDTDARPVQIDNPTTGESATIFGDENDSIAVIRPPK